MLRHSLREDRAAPTNNAFADDNDDSDDDDPDISDSLEQFNNWDHQVQGLKHKSSQKSKRSQNALQPSPKAKPRALIPCEEDLDAVNKKMVATLPPAEPALAAAGKKCPSDK